MPVGIYKRKNEKIEVLCLFCKNTFKAKPSDIKRGGGKYCSIKCSGKSEKGRKNTWAWKTKEKNSKAMKEKWQNPEYRRMILNSRIGKRKAPCSLETRKKIGIANRGENNYGWKGGIESENRRIRQGLDFRLWREAVFIKDNWLCLKCETRGILHPHHIQGFAQFPELRFDANNGVSLHDNCHRNFHKEYGYKDINGSKLLQFIGYYDDRPDR